jgi:hypothetical protein
LRAFLATATLLLALVVSEAHQVNATPTTTTGSPGASCDCSTIAIAPGLRFSISARQPENPMYNFVSIATVPYGPAGRTTFVPLMAAGNTSGAPASPFETISTISRNIVLEHAKPGKMSAVSSGWSNSGGTSVYVGALTNLVLRDGSSGNSGSPVYNASPSGDEAENASSDDKFAATDAAYIPNTGGASPVGTGGSKLSRSVAAGPVYASSIAGSGVSNTPKPGKQSLIDFGTIQLNSSSTLDLALRNLAINPSSSSDLTIEGYTITGADPASFSANLTPGTVIPAGGTLLVPITVVGTGPGDLTSDLTIFTNEGTALGGTDQTFGYLLDPMVVAGYSTSAPEPASLAVLGVGLAALVGVRRLAR